MNKDELTGEDPSDNESEYEDTAFPLSRLVLWKIHNCHFDKPINALSVWVQNNIIVTSSENVAFIWKFDSLRFVGCAVTVNQIEKIFSFKN